MAARWTARLLWWAAAPPSRSSAHSLAVCRTRSTTPTATVSRDLSVDEAVELGRRAIYHATFRDCASGGTVSGELLLCRWWWAGMGSQPQLRQRVLGLLMRARLQQCTTSRRTAGPRCAATT